LKFGNSGRFFETKLVQKTILVESICSILTIPSLLYGCKMWTWKQWYKKIGDSKNKIHETQEDTIYHTADKMILLKNLK